MKRHLPVLLLAALLTACSSTPDGSASLTSHQAAQGTISAQKQPDSDTQNGAGQDLAGLAAIDETIIFQQGGVVITARELKEDTDIGGIDLVLEFENNSGQDLKATLQSIAVNRFMISPWLAAHVPNGTTTTENIILYSKDLQRAGIQDIGEIILELSLYDSETFQIVMESDEILLQTSHYGHVLTPKLDEGQELVNQDGIRIVVKGLKVSSDSGSSLILFMENETDKNIVIQCDRFFINGKDVFAFLSSPLYAGSMAVETTVFYTSDLLEAGVDEISEITMTFTAKDARTRDTLFTVGPVTYSNQKRA